MFTLEEATINALSGKLVETSKNKTQDSGLETLKWFLNTYCGGNIKNVVDDSERNYIRFDDTIVGGNFAIISIIKYLEEDGVINKELTLENQNVLDGIVKVFQSFGKDVTEILYDSDYKELIISNSKGKRMYVDINRIYSPVESNADLLRQLLGLSGTAAWEI